MKNNLNEYQNNLIKFLKNIKSHKLYKLFKFFKFVNHMNSPHIVFYSNPLKIKGKDLDKKISNFKRLIIRSILCLEFCIKNNIYKNPLIIDIIITQVEKCISDEKYWERNGFNSNHINKIILIYKMFLNYLKEYNITSKKKYNILGHTDKGKDLYKFIFKINTSLDIDPNELQLFAIKNLNLQIRNLEKLLDIKLLDKQIMKDDLFPPKEFKNFMDKHKKAGTPIKSEKELLSISQNFVIELHEKTKKLFNKNVIIPDISKVDIKPMSKLISFWSSKGKANSKSIFLNFDNLYKYRKESLKRLIAHESLPGHFLERTNSNKILKEMNLPKDIYYMSMRGIKMIKEGWAVYAENIISDKNNKTEQKYLILNKIFYCIRTIVDIGINYNGMKIETGKQLLNEYTSLHPNSINAEISRYFGNPTQACSYLLGIIYFEFLEREFKNHSSNMIEFYSKLILSPFTAFDIYKYIIKN